MSDRAVQLANWDQLFKTYQFDFSTNRYSRLRGNSKPARDGYIKFCIASPPIIIIKDEYSLWHYLGRKALIRVGKEHCKFTVTDYGPISFARLISNSEPERLHVYTQFLYFAGHLIDPLFDDFDRQMEDFSLFLSRISNE